MHLLEPGEVLAGRFEVLDVLGSGSEAVVYRARDRAGGQLRALKVLRGSSVPQQRWPDEIRFLAGLRHPNLATLHEVVPGEPPVFTLELVEGRDLASLEQPLGPDELEHVARQLLGALAFLHGRGILHRDIKPTNIRRTPDGNAVLIDLGLATLRGRPDAPAGTPAYLAPEILKGQPPTARSDLYALGISLEQAASDAARARFGPFLSRLRAADPATRPASAMEARDELVRTAGLHLQRPTVLCGPRLVGRGPELASACRFLESALARSALAAGLLVRGSPGCGRSRFLLALEHLLQLRGLATVDLLATLPSGLAGDRGNGPQLESLTSANVTSSRARRAGALAARLEAATGGGPVAVVLDLTGDRRDALALVEALIESFERSRRPLVLLLRGDHEDPRLGRELPMERVDLAPLSDPALAEVLADALAMPPELPGLGGVAAAIARRVGGNPGPFLAAVAALIARGDLIVAGGNVRLAVPEERLLADTPPGELALEAARALDGDARRALDLLVRAGFPLTRRRRLSLGIPAQASRRLVEAGLAHVSFAEGGEVLRPVEGLRGLELSETPEVAREQHAALAGALDAEMPLSDLRLEIAHARHRVLAGAGPDAMCAARSLAERALSGGELAQAARLLAAVADQDGTAKDAIDAALSLARIEACLGNEAVAESWLRRAEVLDVGGTSEARHLLARGEVARLLGSIPAAAAALAEALARPSLAARERADALRILAVCELQLGRAAPAEAQVRAALAIEGLPSRERAVGLGTLAQVLHRRGDGEAALACLEEALEIVNEPGEATGTLRGSLLGQRGLVRAQRGDLEGAVGDLTASVRVFRAAGHLVNLAATLSNLGLLLEEEGRLEEALAAQEEGLAIRCRVQDAVGLATSLVNRGSLLATLGRWSTADRDLRDGLGRFEAVAHPRGQASALIELGRVAAALGRMETARAHGREALERARAHGLAREEAEARLALAEALLETDGAPTTDGDGLLEPSFFESAPPRVRVLHATLRARLFRKALRPDEARKEAARALELARACRSPLVRATALAAWIACAPDERPARRELEQLAGERLPPPLRCQAFHVLASTEDVRECQRSLAARLATSLRELAQLVQEEDARTMIDQQWRPRLEDLLQRLEGAGEGAVPAMEALLRVTTLLAGEPEPKELLERILDLALDISGARHAFIVLRTEGGFDCAAARRSGGRSVSVPKKLLSSTIVKDVLAHGRPITTGNARSDPRFASVASVTALELRSIACLPFTAEGTVLGAIYLDHPGCDDLFEGEKAGVLSAFAAQAAQVFVRAERDRRLRELNAKLLEHLTHERLAARQASPDAARLVARSPALRKVLAGIERLGRTAPVLITGEPGTGKEHLAREIHRTAREGDGPFIVASCATLDWDELEPELFGRAPGAQNGSSEDRPGLLRLAAGGTLFLDEIAALGRTLQEKLERALTDGPSVSSGGVRSERASFRLIAATRHSLEELRSKGRLIPPLLARFEGAILQVPPLRDRPEDAAELIDRELAERGLKIEPAVRRRLLAYAWPGNVRELLDELARLTRLASGEVVTEAALSERIRAEAGGGATGDVPYRLEDLRRWALERALVTARGDKVEAARLLGVSRSTLYHELKKLGLGTWLRPYGRRSAEAAPG